MAASGPKIRVLVVDDSVVVRKIISEGLSAEPDVEVVGQAPDGKAALAMVRDLKPDVVTLDVEMPVMDGITCLREIRKSGARVPVIMFSTLTERGARVTLDALSAGASDYIAKPSNVGSVTASKETVRCELVGKIRALTGRARALAAAPAPSRPHSPVRPAPPHGGGVARRLPPEIIAVGVSTGGPNALAEVIPALPADLPVPVVLVQHMPPVFTKLLADRLAAQSKVKVVEAGDGVQLVAGTVYVAPGDFHLEVKRRGTGFVTALQKGPPENSCRPAVDVLFRSVAAAFQGKCLAVVLTGMGQDGGKGAADVRAAGGEVYVQDEATSVVWGMPGYVAAAGLADKVLALPEIAPSLVTAVAAAAPRNGALRPSGPVVSVRLR